MVTAHTQKWVTPDGRKAIFEVDDNNNVLVDAELLNQLLLGLGLTRESVTSTDSSHFFDGETP